MKTVITIFGVLGLSQSIILEAFQIFGILQQNYGIHASLGFLSACVCFSGLEVIEAVRPTDKAGAFERSTFNEDGTVRGS